MFLFNGQLKTEISTVEGRFTGRSSSWLRDGTLVYRQYYLENEPVSREAYDAAPIGNQQFPSCDDSQSHALASDGPLLKRGR